VEVLLEPGLQAFACADEQAAAAGWSKCLGPRVCETGRVYLLRDRAQVDPIRTRGGCSYGFGGSFWFCCRSTAGSPDRPGANRERSGHVFAPGQAPIRTRGGCSYGFGAGFSFVVGAPPRCEPRTKRARISAPGRPHSHPGRVLLRVRRNDLV